MKIWITLRENENDFPGLRWFATEDEADQQISAWMRKLWLDDERPESSFPDDWRDAYEELSFSSSFTNHVSMYDLDLSTHPRWVQLFAVASNLLDHLEQMQGFCPDDEELSASIEEARELVGMIDAENETQAEEAA